MRDLAPPSRAYIRRACLNAGIRPDDCEDATQDVLLDCWLKQDNHIRYRVIDAARRYGWHRKGVRKPTTEQLVEAVDVPAPDPYALADRLMDFMPIWNRLRRSQRKVLLEAALYDGWNNGHQVRASRARLALRRLMA